MSRVLAIASLVALSSSGSLLDACSSDSSPNDGGQGQDATSDAMQDATGSDGGITDAASPCTDSALGCVICCSALYPDASAFVLTDIKDCACVSPGLCNTTLLCGASNDLCTGSGASAACLGCTRDPDAGDCVQKSSSDCNASPSCAPLLGCIASCDGG